MTADGSITALGALKAAWNALWSVVSNAATYFQALVMWVQKSEAAMAALKTALAVLVAAFAGLMIMQIVNFIMGVVTAISALSAALAALCANPLVMLGIALAAAAVAILYWTGLLDKLIEKVKAIAAALSGSFVASMQRASATTTETTNALDKYKNKIQEVTDYQKNMKDAQDNMTASIEKQRKAVGLMTTDTDAYKNKLAEEKKELDEVTKSTDAMNKAQGSSQGKLNDVAVGGDREANALKNLNRQIVDTRSEGERLQDEQNELKSKEMAAAQAAEEEAQKLANLALAEKKAAEEAQRLADSQKRDSNITSFNMGVTLQQAFKNMQSRRSQYSLEAIVSSIQEAYSEGVSLYGEGFQMPDWVNQYGHVSGGKFVGNQGTGATSARGFATGGSFTVGGSGGVDSSVVKFMATPGERVTIETPEQQRERAGKKTAGSSGHNISIVVYAKDVESFKRNKQQVLSKFGSQLVTALSK